MASDFMMPSLSGLLCAGGSRFSPELRQVLQGVSVLYTKKTDSRESKRAIFGDMIHNSWNIHIIEKKKKIK